MPESVRVACASNQGEPLDGHFGSARRFLIYPVSAEENCLTDLRLPDETVMSRVKAFYNVIAALIEKACGLMAVPTIKLTHEGFGRARIRARGSGGSRSGGGRRRLLRSLPVLA